jgi:hypothetical protein
MAALKQMTFGRIPIALSSSNLVIASCHFPAPSSALTRVLIVTCSFRNATHDDDVYYLAGKWPVVRFMETRIATKELPTQVLPWDNQEAQLEGR